MSDRSRHLGELLLLAAIWGASFLFMRVCAAEFGALALAAIRASGAALMLLPLLLWLGGWAELRAEWRSLLLVGIVNNALPFVLFSHAALSITAGLSSILNATTPIWGALVAWVWLRQGLTGSRILGLLLGFAGVAVLAWDKASFKAGGSGWAVLACLCATLCYGIAANLSKQKLGHVRPLTVAAGSQVFAALVLLLPASQALPVQMPSNTAWFSAVMLALLCTGVAYILYFRLVSHAGPGFAVSVTFLIPVFALVWGGLLLGEQLNATMALGCAIVLLGTALAVGVLRLPGRRACQA